MTVMQSLSKMSVQFHKIEIFTMKHYKQKTTRIISYIYIQIYDHSSKQNNSFVSISIYIKFSIIKLKNDK